jgi:hypothetical protein
VRREPQHDRDGNGEGRASVIVATYISRNAGTKSEQEINAFPWRRPDGPRRGALTDFR